MFIIVMLDQSGAGKGGEQRSETKPAGIFCIFLLQFFLISAIMLRSTIYFAM